MNNTTVICPVCGTRMAIPEHQHTVCGTAIGKDSGLGEIKLRTEDEQNGRATNRPNPSRSQERLEKLKAAGIDVSSLVALSLAGGKDAIGRLEQDGNIKMLKEDDPLFDAIRNGHTIPENRLFRRWVTSQVFHMMATGNYSKALHEKGYKYQWTMVIEELRVQARLSVNDSENFALRNRWFNAGTVHAMVTDLIRKTQKELEERMKHPYHCKGAEYIHWKGRDVFVEDIDKKILSAMKKDAKAFMKDGITPDDLYRLTKAYYKTYGINRKDWHKCTEWCNAYKGAGAYFTLRNLILFHGCRIHSESGNIFNETESLAHLELLAQCYNNDGWRMHAYLKKFLDENGVDIIKMMASWRKS